MGYRAKFDRRSSPGTIVHTVKKMSSSGPRVIIIIIIIIIIIENF